MAMLIDLISCSHFLVATVFVNACRDIWWLSVERQQNIAQLVVKTCRNHQRGETKIFTTVLHVDVLLAWNSATFHIGLLSDHVLIILSWLKLIWWLHVRARRLLEISERYWYSSWNCWCMLYFFYRLDNKLVIHNGWILHVRVYIRTKYTQPYFL